MLICGDLDSEEFGPLQNSIPFAGLVGHICETLSFNMVKKATNGDIINIMFVNMMEFWDKSSSGLNDRVSKKSDLLVTREKSSLLGLGR